MIGNSIGHTWSGKYYQTITTPDGVTYGKDNPRVFNVLIGAKSGDTSALIFARITQKDFDDSKNLPLILQEDGFTAEQIQAVQEYIDTEITAGNKFAAAGYLARHRFLKKTIGNNYHKAGVFKGITDAQNRQQIVFSEGVAVPDLTDSDFMYLDTDNDNIVRKDGSGNVMTSKKDYTKSGKEISSTDGSLPVSGAWLRAVGDLIGVSGMKGGKAFIRQLNNKLGQMLGGKFNFTEAPIGHEYYKDGKKVAFVELDPETGDKNIMAFDKDGNKIQIAGIIDADVAKYISGINSGDIVSMPTKDIKWQKTPGKKSSNNERFPDAFLLSLLPLISSNPQLQSSYSKLESELLANARANINEVFNFQDNPNQLLRLLATDEVRMGLRDEILDRDIQKMLDGKININYLFHPFYSRAIQPAILNKMLLQNAIGGRRFNNGTHAPTRPDFNEDLNNKNNFIVGKGNDFFIDFAAEKIEESTIPQGTKEALKRVKRESGARSDNYINLINGIIEDNNLVIESIIYRNPVNGVTSVGTLRLQKIDTNIEADEIVVHPEYGFQRLQFDFDGDTLVAYNLKSATARQGLNELLASKEYESKKTSMTLDVFQPNPQEGNIVIPSDWFKQSINNMQSKNAIGTMVNARNVMNVLSYKDGEMTIKIYRKKSAGGSYNIKVKARNPNSMNTMTFAPLDNTNQSVINGTFLEEGESIVLADGSPATKEDIKNGKTIYLRTNTGRIWEYLVQAAADDKKYQLLSKWGYDGKAGWGIQKSFYKIIEDKNGNKKKVNLSPKEANVVFSVVNENFSTTQIAGGKNIFKSKIDVEGFFDVLADRGEKLESDKQMVAQNAVNSINNTRRKRVKLINITTNGKLTTREKIIKMINDKALEKDMTEILPTNDTNKQKATAEYLRDNLWNHKFHPKLRELLNKHGITPEEITGDSKASDLLQVISTDFYNLNKDRDSKTQKVLSSDKKFKYGDDIKQLIETHEKTFNKLSDKDKALFTYLFFAGTKKINVDGQLVNYRQKITHLPEQLLDGEMYDLYKDLWGQAYQESGNLYSKSAHMVRSPTIEGIRQELNKKECNI
jgi:hypothetical protein